MVLLTNFPPPSEGVQFQQANTGLNIDGETVGTGTLFITQSCVAWQQEEDQKGFTLQYPVISCHAISRDTSTFPHHCLYLMIEGKLPVLCLLLGADSSSDDDDEDDDDDDESDAGLTEIRFIPPDKEMLEAMFAAMSECQALHPDPEDVDSDDDAYADCEDEDEEYYTENGISGGMEEGASGTATSETSAQLSHFTDALRLGQGDGPGPSSISHAVMSSSGDAGMEEEEGMDEEGQFQDAEDMQQ